MTEVVKRGRGRPRKKPGYDLSRLESDFVGKVVHLYQEPYDDREYRDPSLPTIRSVASQLDTTLLRVRKILISADMFSTDTSRQVNELHRKGYSIDDIIYMTGLKRASVHSYLPYARFPYNLDEISSNSERIKLCKKRKKICHMISFHNENLDNYINEAIDLFEGYAFIYECYKRFTYECIGDSIIIKGTDIRYTRDEILHYYHANGKGQMYLDHILKRLDDKHGKESD